MKPTIQVVKRTRSEWEKEWFQFQTSIFLDPDWVESMQTENSSAIYLDFVQSNRVLGKISGLALKSKQGPQLYFYASPSFISSNPDVFKNCLERLLNYAQKNRYNRVIVRPFDQPPMQYPQVKGYTTTESMDYRIDLSQKKIPKLSHGFLSNVKKAAKTGAQFGFDSNPALLPHLFRLMQETHTVRQQKYGVAYNPTGLLNLEDKTLVQLLQTGKGVLYYIVKDGEYLNMQLNIESPDRSYGLLKAAGYASYQWGTSALIDEQLAQRCIQKGYQYFNLGGPPSEKEGGNGLIYYKQAMGALAQPITGYYSDYLLFPFTLINPAKRFLKNHRNQWLIKVLTRWYGKHLAID